MSWTPKRLTKTQLEERRRKAARLFQINQHTQTEITSFLAECINLCSTTNPMQENTSGQVGLK
jgi:hypothetical protein